MFLKILLFSWLFCYLKSFWFPVFHYFKHFMIPCKQDTSEVQRPGGGRMWSFWGHPLPCLAGKYQRGRIDCLLSLKKYSYLNKISHTGNTRPSHTYVIYDYRFHTKSLIGNSKKKRQIIHILSIHFTFFYFLQL